MKSRLHAWFGAVATNRSSRCLAAFLLREQSSLASHRKAGICTRSHADCDLPRFLRSTPKVFWKKVRYNQAQQFKGRRCGEDDEAKPRRKVDTADVVRDSRAPENRGRHKHEADSGGHLFWQP